MNALTADVHEYIKYNTGASFPELIRHVPGIGGGTYALEFPIPNLIMWAGLSEAGCDVFHELKEEQLAHIHVLGGMEAILVHLADGGIPNIPMAKKPPKNGYKDPHWVPVVWYPGPGCNAKNCINPMKTSQHLVQAKEPAR